MAVNDYRTQLKSDVVEQLRGYLEKRWPTPADFERREIGADFDLS